MTHQRLLPRGPAISLLLSLLLICSGLCWAAKRQPLPAHYQHWLQEEVPYIISDNERDLFLGLTSDRDRDAFVTNFWKVRNPDPNAPANSFEAEHYKRLAYANDNFGAPNLKDGWRSDRGMVYITLGPPQQKQVYLSSKYLRPIEIWFYRAPIQALPSFFSVLFYQPNSSQDYKIYSPYGDRPEKLVASTNAVNNQLTALKIIRADLGSEVARLALSLIPGEPIDEKEATPSLQSDVLLNNIRDYRNLPENLELLAARRQGSEQVSHQLMLGSQFSDLSVVTTRDGEKSESVHYLFRFLHPQDFVLARQPDSRFYYSITVKASLIGPDGKPIFEDTQELSDYLPAQRVESIKNQCFGIEGRLPAAPGKYQLQLVVTNNVTKQNFTHTLSAFVPRFDSSLSMSQVFFAANNPPLRDPSGSLPFSFAGVKLSPIGADNTTVSLGKPLRIILALWEAPDSPIFLKGKMLEASYLIGQLGSSAEKDEEKRTIDRGSFDRQGNMLLGNDIPTSTLRQGSYRLVVKITDPDLHQTTSQAVNFQIIGDQPRELWTIISPSFSSGENSALNLYRRGLCSLSQRDTTGAVAYLKEAMARGSAIPSVYTALAAAYRLSGDMESALAVEKQAEAVRQR